MAGRSKRPATTGRKRRSAAPGGRGKVAAKKKKPQKEPNIKRTAAVQGKRSEEPRITAALVAAHGLKPDEYARIRQLSGRTPSLTELGIFSAMWNEHCSYKSSKIHLRTLPTDAPWVIQGPGENAGVIDIGDGR